MTNKLVYSTNGGRAQPEKKQPAAGKSEGPCKMRLETKGRGGKSVTVLFNMPFTDSEMKQWKRDLQDLLGCGATAKDGTIELQGDHRDKIEQFFNKKNVKLVRAGG